MIRKAVLIGGDILTPLGDLHSTWDNLLSGRSGIVPQKFGSMAGRYPLGIIEKLSGEKDSWARLQAMFDRLFVNLPALSEKTLLFCATTKGAVDELLQEKSEVHGQPWQIADYLVNYLGLTESGTTVSAACASGALAIIQGAMRISSGECDHALIVGVDMVTEFTLSGFDSLKALSPDGARPFDMNRNGLSLGDGAGWILLASEDSVRSSDKILARLDSWAVSCDATHITAPCRRASGLIAAIDTIIEEVSVPIGGINGHGTGTVHNDAMELLAFDEMCQPGTPVCSVKGALGHSLGAAGVVEALLSSLSLEHNILPPTIGLKSPEKSSCILSGEVPLPLLSPSILTCNSGFGGINAALFLTK
jgi:3-oxoacyl-(acyl-carrier-protein) synthase